MEEQGIAFEGVDVGKLWSVPCYSPCYSSTNKRTIDMRKQFSVIIVCTICTCFVPALAAQPLTGVIDKATVKRMSAQFNRLKDEGGMSGVSAAIQECYDKAPPNNVKAISECMFLDRAAYSVDQAWRAMLQGGRPVAPPAVTPLLTESAFLERMKIYTELVFGGSAPAMRRYFNNAPENALGAE